ncbi:RRBP1 protein, partial [Upupa epops]|nr:RRBP1 protein [Upupa epops]
MDVYDPQMLGVMVFGGFMVVSAIGIFLVSTFSMKETSYEEALAKQRKELEKTQQQKAEKKKKEKPVEKKGKAKKKEEKPNGKIPEQQLTQEVTNSPKDVVLEPAVVPQPVTVESPITAVPVVPQEKEKPLPVPSPKEKRKKEKKVAKVEPAPSPAVALPPVSVPKSSPVLEVTPKEVPVVAVPPVGTQQSAPVISAVTIKKTNALPNQEEQKQDGPVKKKSSSKKKSEPAPVDSDGPLYLPYKTLVSTVSNMVFSEGEAQQLIEILTEKAGLVQDTWHMATQKGDPVAVLKRQLEEKEKQLTAEQADATTAKNKLRELSKELAAERAKAAAVEGKLKEQLLNREREVAAVQARMQASYRDHISETQQLQGKIRTLQEQLENGPNTQLARLQQENSILRDALNQATSQMESKQNAELAKLRQECNKLMKELSEKSEVLQEEEQQKKNWEIKAAASEKQIEQLQASQRDMEATMQKRLDEVSDELRKTQIGYKTLLADAEKAKGQQQSIAELQAKLLSSEAEVKSKLLELDSVKGKLQDASSENMKLLERIKSIEALLEAGQTREAEKDRELQAANEAEMKQLQSRLQEKTEQLLSLEREATKLRETVEQQQQRNEDLHKKNWKAMEALATVEKTYEEKLLAATRAKEELAQQLDALQTRTKQTLLSALPEVAVSSQQDYDTWLQEFKEKTVHLLKQQVISTEALDSALKLKEAEEAESTLQAECEQYRTTLAETEGMLRNLQKSVEEEEQVWKAKLTASEEELQKSQLQLKSLADMVEKLKADLQSTDQLKEYTSLLETQLENHLETASSERQNYTKEVEALRQLLSESQEQLEAAKIETQKQSKELALVRGGPLELPCWDIAAVPGAGLQACHLDVFPFFFQQLKTQLEQNETLVEKEQVLRQKLSQELEEAQRSVCSLQAELGKLRLAENAAAAADTEEVQHLKERLDKEKKLTKDLGQAATQLQELLQVTQDKLARERETVKKLREQLQQ